MITNKYSHLLKYNGTCLLISVLRRISISRSSFVFSSWMLLKRSLDRYILSFLGTWLLMKVRFLDLNLLCLPETTLSRLIELTESWCRIRSLDEILLKSGMPSSSRLRLKSLFELYSTPGSGILKS